MSTRNLKVTGLMSKPAVGRETPVTTWAMWWPEAPTRASIKTTHNSHMVLRQHSLPTTVTQRMCRKGRSHHKLVAEILMPENGYGMRVLVKTRLILVVHFILFTFLVFVLFVYFLCREIYSDASMLAWSLSLSCIFVCYITPIRVHSVRVLVAHSLHDYIHIYVVLLSHLSTYATLLLFYC